MGRELRVRCDSIMHVRAGIANRARKGKNEEKAPYRIYIADNEYIDAKEPHAAIVFF